MGNEIKKIEEKAKEIRRLVIESVSEAGSGHIAGPLDLAEIFAAFYFEILNHRPSEPDWPERDRLILSCGHTCPAQYAALALAGYFPVEEMKTLRKFGSRLQGHPERGRLPGIETTSGPLGEGLGQAAGVALGAKMDGKKFKIYSVMSDGEQEEGSTWEAAMFAAKNKLDNLIAVIDANNIQISGAVSDVMPIEPLAEKYRAFGWNVLECDGNNIAEFLAKASDAKNSASGKPCEKDFQSENLKNSERIFISQGKPFVIIARTLAGKAVPEIEGDYRWHGRAPTAQETKRFLGEL